MRRLAKKQRQDEQDGNDRSNHATDDDPGERLLRLCSNAVRERRRQQAEAGGHAGHHDGTHLVDAAVLQARAVDALALGAAYPGHEDDSAQRGYADQRGESDGSRDAERRVRDEERRRSADSGEGQRRDDDEGVLPSVELNVEQDDDDGERDGDDDGEALLLLAQRIELARPVVVVAGGQLNGLLQPALQLRDRGGEVAAANAELDGDVAASVFAIDHEAAFANGHIGDLPERNAPTIGGRNEDGSNRVGAAAIGLGIAHREVEAPVALDDLRDGSASDGCLHRGVDVTRKDAVPRGFGAIDLDDERRLSAHLEDAHVCDTGNRLHRLLDLAGEAGERVEVVAEELERVLSLHARHRLFDVVLNVLREVEFDAREAAEARVDLVDELRLGETGTPLLGGLQSN